MRSIFELRSFGLLSKATALLLTGGLVSAALPGAFALSPQVSAPRFGEARQLVQGSEYFTLSQASGLIKTGKHAEALNSLVLTVEKNPVNILGLYHLGNTYLELAKDADLPAQRVIYLEQAQQAFERVTTLNDELTLTYFKLGKIALMQNDPEAAKQYYRTGLTFEPQNAALIFNLARVYDQLGEREQAIQHYLKTLEADPAFTYAYNNLGLLYEESHDVRNAEKAYKQALKQDHDYNLARLNLGNLYAANGQYELAEKTLSDAQLREPENEWVYYYQGNMYLRKGAFEQAVNAYSRALEINPKHSTTYYLLAVSLTKLKKMDDALQASLSYMQLAPDGEYAREMKSLIMAVKLSQSHGFYLKGTQSGAKP